MIRLKMNSCLRSLLACKTTVNGGIICDSMRNEYKSTPRECFFVRVWRNTVTHGKICDRIAKST